MTILKSSLVSHIYQLSCQVRPYFGCEQWWVVAKEEFYCILSHDTENVSKSKVYIDLKMCPCYITHSIYQNIYPQIFIFVSTIFCECVCV